jgi:hypothetical protein
MTTIQIHAGNHKTGTTAIQRVLREMRPRLARKRVIMPGLDDTDAKHAEVNHELSADPPPARSPRLDRILDNIRAAGPGTRHLLTNETFIGVDPQRMRSALAPADAARTMVYFYVRPHAGLLVSLYLQSVKNGRVWEGPEDFVSNKEEKAAFHFMDAIDGYGRVFGTEDVFVREFARDRLIDGSIIADFWDFLDLPARMLPRALAVADVANPTPKTEVAEILRALTTHFRRLGGRKPSLASKAAVFATFRAFNETAPDLPGTPYRLTVDLQTRLADLYQERRRDFAGRWFHKPPSDGWLTEPVSAPLPPVDPPREVIATVFARARERNGARRLTAQADLMQDWLARAPTRTEAGVTVIPIDGLVAHFAALAADA